MDLSTFYAVVSATCFTLVGLWWSAVDRRRELLRSPTTRRLVGGVYLTFLLPGVMGLFAQVDPGRPGLWRTTFGAAAIVGAWSTIRLVREDRGPGPRGPFRRHRWIVAVLFLVVLALGVAPGLADVIGLTGLQGAAIAVSCLVVLAHGLAWELLTTDDGHDGHDGHYGHAGLGAQGAQGEPGTRDAPDAQGRERGVGDGTRGPSPDAASADG